MNARSLMLIGCGMALASCLACATFQSRPPTQLWFHEQVSSSVSARAREVTIPITNLRLTVSAHPVLTERDVIEAELVETAGGLAALIKFDAHGRMALDQVTTKERGRHLVVFLNNKAIAAWLVDRRLSLGQFLLESSLTDDEVRDLVAALNVQGRRNQSR